MAATIPVGIDLGTSFSAVSFIDANGNTRLIANENGEKLTPSVVYFGDDQISVGRRAWNLAIQDSDRVAENVKRDMGSAAYRQQIGGKDYPPEVIQSCILRRLHRDITTEMGENYQAVITVPAYFDEARRKATCDAATMSGLPVLDIVNEPTAAALSFGELIGYLTPEGAPRECLNVLVYDLGGGTFDVTVIRLSSTDVRTLATDGDYELGGVNWDQRLAEHAHSRFLSLWPNSNPLHRSDHIRLSRASQAAKHELTDKPLTVLEFTHDNHLLKLPITREEFEDLTSDLLERTIFTTRQAMQAAGLIWNDIDRLLLVGGSSRMPVVRRALNELTGMEADTVANPDEAVARGAAIYARYLLGLRGIDGDVPKLRITDVNSHGLGIEGVNLETLRNENVAIIPRNTPLPREIRRTFVTRADNQPNVKVVLLEGESSVPSQCSRLATATIKNLPPGLPKGTPIDVRYSLHANGRLSVSAAIPGHGDDAQIELQRVRGLADRRLQGWKKIICRNGGYRDFRDAPASLCEPDAKAVTDVVAEDWGEEGAADVTKKFDFEPAVSYGAPRAAADTLQAQIGERTWHNSNPFTAEASSTDRSDDFGSKHMETRVFARKRTDRSILRDLAGYVLGAVVGLSLGYYVLCAIRPEANFFHLNLPGIRNIGRDGK